MNEYKTKAAKEMSRMSIRGQDKHVNRLDAQTKSAVKILNAECKDHKYYMEHQRDFHF